MAVKSLVYDCETVFSVSLHCYHIDRLRKKKSQSEGRERFALGRTG